MATISVLDETHGRLQLGSHEVTLDIPPDLVASGWDPQEKIPAPSVDLQLEWVHGYRGRDCRNNLVFSPATHEIIYCIAGLVVLFDVRSRTQRHYAEHTDDVKCLAQHPDGNLIASGQVAGHSKRQGEPHVRVWKTDSLETVIVLGLGSFQRAVSCVAFSKADSGEKLCVVDEADDHFISIWDWRRQREISEARGSKEPILDVEFHPLENNVLVSCGKGQITFWTVTDTRKLTSQRGMFKEHDVPRFILCLAFSPSGDLLSGDSNGSILVWGKGKPKVTRAISEAHSEAVMSINFLTDGRMISGGQGGNILVWDAACKRRVVDLSLEDFFGSVRCVIGTEENNIVIGTTKNFLLEGSLEGGLQPIIQGHRDEVWGLAAHPSEPLFASAGYDRRFFLWDLRSRSAVWRVQLRRAPHSVAFSPDGSLLAVGCQTGHWVLLDAASGRELESHRISKEQLECTAFSPAGDFVAFGSRDNKVLLYAVDGTTLQRVGKLVGHTSYVTHLDWSADGKYMRTTSGDYEILYWRIPDCTREFSDEVTNAVTWATDTCTLTFNVAGIWQDANDGTDVNTCGVNADKTLVASGDDFGNLNLFSYPCTSFQAEKRVGRGHSSHVTNVQFASDGSLLTAGGKDMALFQWRIV